MKKMLLCVILIASISVRGQVEKSQVEKPEKEIKVAPMGNFFASADVYTDKVLLSFGSTNQFADVESFLVSKEIYRQVFDVISKEKFDKGDSYDVTTLDGSIVKVMFRKQMMCYSGYIAMFYQNGEPHILNASTKMSKSQMRKLFDIK